MLLLLQTQYYFSLLFEKTGLWFIDLSESKQISSVTAYIVHVFTVDSLQVYILGRCYFSLVSIGPTLPLTLDDITDTNL